MIDEQTLEFLLFDCLRVDELLALPYFAHHSHETLALSLRTAQQFAKEQLQPLHAPMDRAPPELKDGHVLTHPDLKRLYAAMAENGFITSERSLEVGGQQLPFTVALAMNGVLSAANMGAACYVGLSDGAAHLIESFGSEELKKNYMVPMYEGRWTGTMALTEPQAGSSLADVRSRATPARDGSYKVKGSKVFISGGDNSFAENIVHLVLARIDGAPAGVKGVSLFCVPKKRLENGKLVPNDVATSGVFHKMGWKALPSIALELGEEGACVGYLVGEANQGLRCMFQMMNGARLAVGMSSVATASAAYQTSLRYARERPQGRPATNRDPATAQIPIIQHADVRRMLLAQKAIIEGSLALVLRCGLYADLAAHSGNAEVRARSQKLLDFLTPIAKAIPSEKGFEANTLAVQIHGGYGYTSEYLPELYLREQKLNTLHEGTTGIQSLDLLGRKILGDGGQSAMLLNEEIQATIAGTAGNAELAPLGDMLANGLANWSQALMTLGQRAAAGELERALSTSVWHLELAGILVVAWQLLDMARIATASAAGGQPGSAAARKTHVNPSFVEGKVRAAHYWFEYEMAKVVGLCNLLNRERPSYLEMNESSF